MNGISGMNPQAEAFAHFLNLCMELPQSDGFLLWTHPYFNCRERGFVHSLKGRGSVSKHWAFFEHRNSDDLCVVAWEDSKHYPDSGDFYTWKDIPESVYKDKWSVTKSFRWGNFGEAASWLQEEMCSFIEVRKQVAA